MKDRCRYLFSDGKDVLRLSRFGVEGRASYRRRRWWWGDSNSFLRGVLRRLRGRFILMRVSAFVPSSGGQDPLMTAISLTLGPSIVMA